MPSAPTIFVIFGVTGDLSQKKLLPALFSLYKNDLLPTQFKIVGFSRREWVTRDLHIFVESIIKKTGVDKVQDFLNHIEHAKGLFDNLSAYQNLKEQLDAIDTDWGICSNKLLYLAVSPQYYGTIFDELKKSKLSLPCGGDLGWTRILVEKPFGNDTKTAAKLETQLSRIFKEPQIFRIDHYLAKETVQNILAFRFANSLFEPLWDARSIDHIEIILHQKNLIEDRGDFYNTVGALRDVGQNHLLQMLALIAMDKPTTFSSDEIRKKRAAVLEKLSISKGDWKKVVRAQYVGFTKEKGVTVHSQTETYFKIPVSIGTHRWKKVPFILESGKGLSNSKTEIVVYFKKLPGAEQNVLRFRIQPNEGIDITFWVKKPGFMTEHHPKTLSFSYVEEEMEKELPDAYERVLFESIRGDQTLFASSREVQYSWEFITPILKKWQKIPLRKYEKGTVPA